MNSLQKARIKRLSCLFTPLRVSLENKRLYTYELQTEDGFNPTVLKRQVIVNHFGTIFTDEEIVLKDGYMELNENDFEFID